MIVPDGVGKCPYCGGQLDVSSVVGEYLEEGVWLVDDVHLDCMNEPDIDSEEWVEFNKVHSWMPYVYWLPVQEKVIYWLNVYRLKEHENT
jgi:hypothetical protein